jgi:2'-5' RNA ligase
MINVFSSTMTFGGLFTKMIPPKDIGYSVWAMPGGAAFDELSALIRRFAEIASTPAFLPHVTLLGNVHGDEDDLISRTQQIASELQPYEISYSHLGRSSEYYRCLFANVRKTASVAHAYEIARYHIRYSVCAEYGPHLSLMYGNPEERQKLNSADKVGIEEMPRFWVKSLHLFVTSGPVALWRPVKECGIG